MQPHRQQPTRLPRPWDSPGKNTGVGCHFLLQCMKVKNESEVAQSCPTLATPRTAAYRAPPSMGFSRQEYWSGVPSPSPKAQSRCYLYSEPTGSAWPWGPCLPLWAQCLLPSPWHRPALHPHSYSYLSWTPAELYVLKQAPPTLAAGPSSVSPALCIRVQQGYQLAQGSTSL